MGADYFEYRTPYQPQFAGALEALVRHLLESGEESITPDLDVYFAFLDVRDEADLQMWLER